MPSDHTKISQIKKKRRTVKNKPSKQQMSIKRLRSSDTDPETSIIAETKSVTKMATEMEEESEMESTTEPSEFMDKIDCYWDEIVLRLRDSHLWKEQEQSMEKIDQDMEDLRRENDFLRKRLLVAEGRLTRTEKRLEEANNRIIDLTSRSMRDNLVLKNLEETDGEDLELKVRHIMKEKLRIQDVDICQIQIERVHRVGNRVRGRIRNVVAKFSSKGKSIIMRHLKNLSRDDKLQIQEQYPPEVHTRRNKLWPQFISARQAGKAAKFTSDKLIVDKKVVHSPQDSIRDINLDITSRSLEMKPKHTTVVTSEGNHLQGHSVPVTNVDDVIPAIQALCTDHRVAGATNVIYAYRIGNDQKYISNYEDDGEWGGGREIMKILDNTNCFNRLIAVTRWRGNRQLGPNRYQQIRDVAQQAVSLTPSTPSTPSTPPT